MPQKAFLHAQKSVFAKRTCNWRLNDQYLSNGVAILARYIKFKHVLVQAQLIQMIALPPLHAS